MLQHTIRVLHFAAAIVTARILELVHYSRDNNRVDFSPTRRDAKRYSLSSPVSAPRVAREFSMEEQS